MSKNNEDLIENIIILNIISGLVKNNVTEKEAEKFFVDLETKFMDKVSEKFFIANPKANNNQITAGLFSLSCSLENERILFKAYSFFLKKGNTKKILNEIIDLLEIFFEEIFKKSYDEISKMENKQEKFVKIMDEIILKYNSFVEIIKNKTES